MSTKKKPVKIGSRVVASGRPLVVGVVTGPGWEESAWRLADILEVRADCLPVEWLAGDRAVLAGWVKGVREKSRKPLLLTVRRFEESGQARRGTGTSGEDARLEVFRALLPLVQAVDIEAGAPCAGRVVTLARRRGIPVVGSFHDFEKTPAESVICEKMNRAFNLGAQVFKLACRAEKPAALAALAGFCRLFGRARLLAVVPMGKYAHLARLFFPLLGSTLVYGSLGAPTAPGQPSVEALRADLARFYEGGGK